MVDWVNLIFVWNWETVPDCAHFDESEKRMSRAKKKKKKGGGGGSEMDTQKASDSTHDSLHQHNSSHPNQPPQAALAMSTFSPVGPQMV